ncbi:MAG: hypothetical protein ACT4PW_12860 [Acidimicrobiia bacterium]
MPDSSRTAKRAPAQVGSVPSPAGKGDLMSFTQIVDVHTSNLDVVADDEA